MIKELALFTIKQAKSCIFPVSIFSVLFISNFWVPNFLHRYDFILLCLVIIQTIFILLKQETKQELLVIFSFHFFGLFFEIFKVNQGVWSYPEDAIFKIFQVPVYSGFMYAAVATYVIHAWKNLKLQLLNWPQTKYVLVISSIIYLNFFTNHYIYDFRWVIIVAIIFLFKKTSFNFQVGEKVRNISASLSFLLISFFIWMAENISTLLKAWQYPHQSDAWSVVDIRIISSWFLLVIFVVTLTITLSQKYKEHRIE